MARVGSISNSDPNLSSFWVKEKSGLPIRIKGAGQNQVWPDYLYRKEEEDGYTYSQHTHGE